MNYYVKDIHTLKAKAMTFGEYTSFKALTIGGAEKPEDPGYMTQHDDDHISWMPAKPFEDAFLNETITFPEAIALIKRGLKLTREGWNGKGMFIYYVPANEYPANGNKNGTMDGVFPDDMVPYGAYIAMKTAQNNVVPWLASQTDMLTDDWVIFE